MTWPPATHADVVTRLDSLQMFDLRDYGAVPNDPAQEVGPAWDAAMTALVAAGGGTIWLADNTYYTARAPQTSQSGYAQLPLPNRARTDERLTVRIAGAFPPSIERVEQTVVQKLGGTIISTLTGATINAGKIPSVIGSMHRTDPTQVDTFSNILAIVENMTVLTPANPTVTAVNLDGAAQGWMRGTVVLNINALASTLTATVPTTPHAFGVIMPGVQNNAVCEIDQLVVAGYYTGVGFNEHVNARHIQVAFNRVGLSMFGPYMNHASQIDMLSAENNPYVIAYVDPASGVTTWPGVGYLWISSASIEDNPSGIWVPVSHVHDPGTTSKFYCDIKYLTVLGGSGPREKALTTTGAYIKQHDLHSAVTTQHDHTQRANSTSTPNPSSDGSLWSVTNGTWGIISNELYCPSGTALATLTRSIGNPDMFISCKFPQPLASGQGLHFRYLDQNNMMVFQPASGLYEIIGGSVSSQLISGYANVPAANDIWELWVRGPLVKLYKNNAFFSQHWMGASLLQNTAAGLLANADDTCRFTQVLTSSNG